MTTCDKAVAVLAAFLIGMSAGYAQAANYNEVDFNSEVCKAMGGTEPTKKVAGYKLQPDCKIGDQLIEADWGYKIYEGIGQAMIYADAFGGKPHLFVYIRTENQKVYKKDMRKLKLLETLDTIPHTVFFMNRDTGEWKKG